MKPVTVLTCFLLVINRFPQAAEIAPPLEQLVRAARERGMDYNLSAIADNLGFFRRMPAFAQLIAEVGQTPAFFSKSNVTRALTKPEQEMAITAAWSLPDDKYLLFAQDAVLETEKGRMQWENLEYVLWPATGQPSHGVLTRHQTDSEVIQLLRRARVLFPQIPYFLHRIDELLAGESQIVSPKLSEAIPLKNGETFVPGTRLVTSPQNDTVVVIQKPETKSWPVAAALIIAAIGLLWLLLKRRS